MPTRPRRIRLVAAVAVVAAPPSAGAGAALSPKAQPASILDTARAQHSLHYVKVVTLAGVRG